MKSAFLLSCVALLLVIQCKTGEKTGTGSSATSSTSNNFVEDEKTGLLKNQKWGTSLQEGWLGDSSAQALVSQSGASDEEAMKKEARERLAWLLLLDSYDLGRSDKSLAGRLARSKLFKSFGEEKVFKHNQQGKTVVIVQRKSSDLRKNWQNIMSRVEAKEPRLTSLRRKKN